MTKPTFIQTDQAYGKNYINLSQIVNFRKYVERVGVSVIYAELSSGRELIVTKMESKKADEFLDSLMTKLDVKIVKVID